LLTASIVLLLLLDPWLSRSIGFALSVAATAALLVLAGPLADGLSRWMPRTLALFVAVPLSAQLACGPIIVLISPQVSIYGVAANMLAAPAAPVGTVLGLAACLCAGIPSGAGLAALAWVPAAWIAATATTLSTLPGSAIWWPEGVEGLAALTLASAAVVVLLLRTPRSARVAAVVVLAVTAVVVAATGPAAQVGLRARLPSPGRSRCATSARAMRSRSAPPVASRSWIPAPIRRRSRAAWRRSVWTGWTFWSSPISTTTTTEERARSPAASTPFCADRQERPTTNAHWPG
jgi:hypothetical protein